MLGANNTEVKTDPVSSLTELEVSLKAPLKQTRILIIYRSLTTSSTVFIKIERKVLFV